MPTSRTKAVEYALNELVASRVPTRASQKRLTPAARESAPLRNGPADLLAAARVPGRGRDHHAALDQLAQLVDLLGVVAAVGHRDDDDGGDHGRDAVPDRPRRSGAGVVVHGAHPVVGGRVLRERGDRGVVLVVVDHEHLARQVHPGEDAVEARDDLVAFVEHRDHDRHARVIVSDHTRTPLSMRFHTSTIGRSVSIDR